MKLSPGFNFTKILLAAFTRAYLKNVKKNDDLTVLFALLESRHIKAVHKMLVKSTPEVGCGNMLLQS
jgi:hypothetical protein